ncbi:glycosyltransferase family 4 protein [Georgenia sp. Z1344]|uniref:glycosyltransferase family 4 protein n=1 Tax=Georgenia sp. Z1344 TaxID=3416706 RepID=UPI003CF0D6B6
MNNVVVVINQYAMPAGVGAGSRHADLFGGLTTWSPVIITSDRTHQTQELVPDADGFILLRLPKYNSNGIRRVFGFVVYGFKSALTAFRLNPDVVYASTPHLLSALSGLAVSKLRRVPFVLEVRDLWPASIVDAGVIREGGLLEIVLSWLERVLARSADSIVVVTPGWEEHYGAMGIESSRIVVVPNSADLARLRREPKVEVGVWRSERFKVVYAGSHGPKNGIDYIIDAAAKLPEVDFLLIGGGASKGAAVQRVERERLRNVEFRAPVPKDDLADVLADCDAGIFSISPYPVFRLGMSPNKVFDYLGAGLPVVSNAKVPLRHVMADNECGRLGDIDELTECIEAVRAATVEQRAEWVERGRGLVESRFSRSAGIRALESVLDRARRINPRLG